MVAWRPGDGSERPTWAYVVEGCASAAAGSGEEARMGAGPGGGRKTCAGGPVTAMAAVGVAF